MERFVKGSGKSEISEIPENFRFSRGDVVVLSFPFSDSAESKKRPALIIANTFDENLILCQITSQARPDPNIITITKGNFQEGIFRTLPYVLRMFLFLSLIGYMKKKMKSVEDLRREREGQG